jgi:hypothetical protein
MKAHICILTTSLCFLLSVPTFAEEHAHAGGSYYHGNGYYNHNNGWNGGSVNVNTWNDGVWYDDNLNDDTGVVVGAPEPGYYDPSCQTIDDCSTGTCVLVNTCEQE